MDDEQKINEVIRKLDDTREACPRCGSDDLEVLNYDMMWHEGDVHCRQCGKFVRTWDAG